MQRLLNINDCKFQLLLPNRIMSDARWFFFERRGRSTEAMIPCTSSVETRDQAECWLNRGMFELTPHGPDTFVGTGPRYPWGGLYGGQIVAQALRAATLTAEPEFRPHSIRAYFIRPGDHNEPSRYEVVTLTPCNQGLVRRSKPPITSAECQLS